MTDIPREVVAETERRYGVPREACLEEHLLGWELDLIEKVCGQRRFHDLTVFVLSEGHLALVHKPSEPEGVYWAPAGGWHQDETMAAGVRREVLEETGLEVQVERYLLRVHARFHSEGRSRPWTTHLFLARPQDASATSRSISPVDTKEVERAAWVGVEEFVSRTVPILGATGWGRFRYRVGLARLAFAELGLSGWPNGIRRWPTLE